MTTQCADSFIPTADLKVGDTLAGGKAARGVRRSKSGATTYITIDSALGGTYEFRQATRTNIFVEKRA
jgi:hypothetical protein